MSSEFKKKIPNYLTFMRILVIPFVIAALFLPQIWESFSSPREFLAHLKRKAGLSPDYKSPTLKVYRFEVIDISSGDLEDPASVWRAR